MDTMSNQTHDTHEEVQNESPSSKQQLEAPSFFKLSFQGRYGRLNYINAVFVITLVGLLVFCVLFGLSLLITLTTRFYSPILYTYIGAAVFMLFFMTRATALRLHDLNKTGWFAVLLFLSMIPYAGVVFTLIFNIYLMCFKGSKGENTYGTPFQKGNTLGLKLLIISPIFAGITYLFVLPAYQDYKKRTYVVESFSLARYAQKEMIEYHTSHKSWPPSNAEAGLPDAYMITGTAIAGIEVKNSMITIKYNGRINNHTITLTPEIIKGKYSWNCKGGTLPNKFRPKACRK